VFQGQSLRLGELEAEGIVELCFDRAGEAINKFDDRTVGELREAVQVLQRLPGLRGVLTTSAKDVFIVGADITEFGRKFSEPSEAIAADVSRSNEVFTAFEDLPVPSVVAINGFALGGGLEFTLANTFRVMSAAAQIGVPEVKLGLFPAFGGTVRLSRIAGPAVACEWVATGRPSAAAAALAAGVVDAVAEPVAVRKTALAWLRRAISGEIDWTARQQTKRESVPSPRAALESVFSSARALVERTSAAHQPAAAVAIGMMHRAASLDRAAALALEAKTFGEVARTQAAVSLVQAFLDEQAVKKRSKALAKDAVPVRKLAVLGAGIMGRGIAIAGAMKGATVLLKDVNANVLELGMSEARKHVARQIAAQRMSEERGTQAINAIKPGLDDAGVGEVDLVVEAMVEDLETKRKALSALEKKLRPGCVIASNTSSLRIDDIAAPLQRSADVVGMHFFNPVTSMPLIEIVRGARTRDAAMATAAGYALSLGKTPIVVADRPGFLVNRLFTAYIRAFLRLLADGADFVKVDHAIEAFGWPMGPAALEDVIGLDTGSRVNDIISAGYPERMQPLADDALKLLARLGRLGQKSGLGFYRYEADPRGKPVRSHDSEAHQVLSALQPLGRREFAASDIVDRMMLPMTIEAAHALEEGVVSSAAELDVATRLGLGFPAYAGGPLQYADWLGWPELFARCERLRQLGLAYEPTPRMRAMAERGERYHAH
jgi:3-hydroxyacyl-CoA dehydrogenase/enoyl-CoA hydratase/3-hydroxybutyryl-CoA epimerase/enoyl-CoA isomerase